MKIIRANLQRYTDAPKRIDKSLVVSLIVSSLKDDGYNFVRQDTKTRRWFQLSDPQVHEKTGHAIRDVLKNMKSKPAKKTNAKTAKNAKNTKNAGGKRGKKRKSPSPLTSQQSQQSQSFTIHNSNINQDISSNNIHNNNIHSNSNNL